MLKARVQQTEQDRLTLMTLRKHVLTFIDAIRPEVEYEKEPGIPLEVVMVSPIAIVAKYDQIESSYVYLI